VKFYFCHRIFFLSVSPGGAGLVRSSVLVRFAPPESFWTTFNLHWSGLPLSVFSTTELVRFGRLSLTGGPSLLVSPGSSSELVRFLYYRTCPIRPSLTDRWAHLVSEPRVVIRTCPFSLLVRFAKLVQSDHFTRRPSHERSASSA
jgi:hypothetical protein